MIDVQKSIDSGVLQGCDVKNLELLVDFSLLNNIFCDKTGTLTKNELKFKKFSFNGKVYEFNENLKDNLPLEDK